MKTSEFGSTHYFFRFRKRQKFWINSLLERAQNLSWDFWTILGENVTFWVHPLFPNTPANFVKNAELHTKHLRKRAANLSWDFWVIFDKDVKLWIHPLLLGINSLLERAANVSWDFWKTFGSTNCWGARQIYLETFGPFLMKTSTFGSTHCWSARQIYLDTFGPFLMKTSTFRSTLYFFRNNTPSPGLGGHLIRPKKS